MVFIYYKNIKINFENTNSITDANFNYKSFCGGGVAHNAI
jgi:hypothetical protein